MKYILVRFFTVALAFVSIVSIAQAQTYTAPTGAPPTGNVPMPINVGATLQAKAGTLRLGSSSTAATTAKLDVVGIGAFQGLANFGTAELLGVTHIGPCTGCNQNYNNNNNNQNFEQVNNTTAPKGFFAVLNNFFTPKTAQADVLNTNNTNLMLKVDGNARYLGDILLNNTNAGGAIYGYDKYHFLKLRDGGTNWTTLGDYGGIRFSTGNNSTTITEKMQIAPNGNVGIGITNPTAKLEVNGIVRVAGNSNASLQIGPYSTSYSTALIEATNNANMAFRTDGNDRMTISNTGYVGIGTNVPSTTLDVNGWTKTTNLMMTSGAGVGKVLVSSNSNGYAVWKNTKKLYRTNYGGCDSLTNVAFELAPYNYDYMTSGYVTEFEFCHVWTSSTSANIYNNTYIGDIIVQ